MKNVNAMNAVRENARTAGQSAHLGVRASSCAVTVALFSAIVITHGPQAQAQAADCVYADKGYTTGAEACFCPSIALKLGSYRIRQERWRCDDKGVWQKTERFCADVSLPDRRAALETLKDIERGSC